MLYDALQYVKRRQQCSALCCRHGKNLNSDAWKALQLWRHTCNPAHPCHRFSSGNKDTLFTGPQSQGIDTLARVGYLTLPAIVLYRSRHDTKQQVFSALCVAAFQNELTTDNLHHLHCCKHARMGVAACKLSSAVRLMVSSHQKTSYCVVFRCYNLCRVCWPWHCCMLTQGLPTVSALNCCSWGPRWK